ncbi:MAG: DUF4153 domain-containing protein [Ignavibacteriales bacterium]|nr:DUF4153 domain-containing protein [Ignavibacteriales bacterium]
MKLPSITQAVRDARLTFVRFPLVITDALIGTVAMLILIDHEQPPNPSFLFQVVSAAVLGFPLLACLAITAEKKKWGKSISLGAQFVGLVLVALYSLSVPQDLINAPAIHMIRMALLGTGLVLAALVAPYMLTGSVHGFWQYCKTIVLRLLIAFLYAVVLWIGLALALAALNNLFGVEIPGRRYFELWVALQGIFTPWFFLAGMPDDLNELDTLTEYPKGLKIFSQYILLPLVLTYLVILYAYLGKILLAWDWPQGWVSALILGFISTGLFSIVLLHPINGRTENVWINTASRWFFVVIIPLIIMLFLAIWRRVSEYGVTEGRYLAIALGIWLCIIVVYFIISKAKNIMMLPASLCLASFLVTFGPWSTFAVSERSQIARLQDLLTKNKILVNGSVHAQRDSIPFEDTKQISAIISYLHDIHGYSRIQPWFAQSLLKDSGGSLSAYQDPAGIAKLMGVEYVEVWRTGGGGMMVFFTDKERPMEIGGYDQMWRGQRFIAGETKSVSNGTIRYRLDAGMNSVTIFAPGDGTPSDSLVVDLGPAIDGLVKSYGFGNNNRVAPEKMSAGAANEHFKVKVNLTFLRIERKAGVLKPMAYDGDILYTIGR